MKKQNTKRIEHRNKSRQKKATKAKRRERARSAKIVSSLEKKLGMNKAKPHNMKLPGAQEMKRKGNSY